MVTGSLGSGFHGEPRASRDVDIVIDASAPALEEFLDLARDRFYVSTDEARDALARQSLFNVVDLVTGWKADLIFVKDRPFSRTEFERRRPARIHELSVFVVSPEDAILSKLEWSRESGSEVQLRDVRGIVAAQGSTLDVEYLRQWAAELGVRDALDRVLPPEVGA